MFHERGTSTVSEAWSWINRIAGTCIRARLKSIPSLPFLSFSISPIASFPLFFIRLTSFPPYPTCRSIESLRIFLFFFFRDMNHLLNKIRYIVWCIYTIRGENWSKEMIDFVFFILKNISLFLSSVSSLFSSLFHRRTVHCSRELFPSISPRRNSFLLNKRLSTDVDRSANTNGERIFLPSSILCSRSWFAVSIYRDT